MNQGRSTGFLNSNQRVQRETDSQMEIIQTISMSMGAGWASGLNLYATIFVLGFLNSTGDINLPPDLQVLSNPLVMAVAGIMYVVEFFADKIPALDTVWDSIHTFIRIPAGAILAAGAIGDVSTAAELAAALMGGTMAAASHTAKAGTRVLINASPEPFTNWGASLSEDVLAVGGLYTAVHYPWWFLAGLALFLLLLIWLAPKIWRGIKKIFRTIGGWLGMKPKEASPVKTAASDQTVVSTDIPAQPETQQAEKAPQPAPLPGQTPAGQTQAPPSDEIEAKLTRLERLKESGSISQEEYEQLRAKALAKLI
jgi:hypothetical protein